MFDHINEYLNEHRSLMIAGIIAVNVIYWLWLRKELRNDRA